MSHTVLVFDKSLNAIPALEPMAREYLKKSMNIKRNMGKNVFKFLLLVNILLLYMGSFSIQAQAKIITPSADNLPEVQVSHARSDVESLWSILQRIDKNLWDIHASERVSKADIDRLFSLDCNGVGLHFENGRALREDARASANDPGLDLEGGLRSGLDQSNGGGLTTSTQSAYIGLGWDVLNGGWRENKGKGHWFDLRADRADLRAKMEYEDRLNQCRSDKIPNVFLPQKSKLLHLKSELLRLLVMANKKAYLQGETYLEDMLKAEQELQVASNDLSNIQPKLTGFSLSELNSTSMMPLLDVNIEVIIDAIDNDQRPREIAHLDAEIINQKKANEREARLRFYLRYEASGNGFQKHGPAGGVRFNVPIFEDKKAGANSYIAQSETELKESLILRKRNAKHAYKKFLEERERAVRQWYRYLRSAERSRRSLIQEKFNNLNANTTTAAERAVTVIDAAIELERAHELLYRRASEVLSYAQILYQPDYISIAPIINEGYRGRSGDRSIYIWSKTFNAHSNDFIHSFLRTKQINSVLISASKKANKEKILSFLYQARKDRLRVEPVFSDNGWLDRDHYDDAVHAIRMWTKLGGDIAIKAPIHESQQLTLKRIGGPEVLLFNKKTPPKHQKTINTGIGAIHLDIEPQALDRYKGKDKKAIARPLQSLLEYLHQQFPQIDISVSLPVYWDAKIYQEISALTGQLYMMSYGSHKASTIIRRLSEVRSAVDDSKIVVALRATDYSSELELENIIAEIRAQTGIQHFAIHAMRDYISLTDQQKVQLKHANRTLAAGNK
jgi:hypothetical protein